MLHLLLLLNFCVQNEKLVLQEFLHAFKNKEHRRYCSSSSVIVIFVEHISLRFARINFLNIILSQICRVKVYLATSLRQQKKLCVSGLLFSLQISKVILEMNLNVIEKLNILVLVDNKTDSLSSIPDLVAGKSQFRRIYLYINYI